MPFTNTIEQPMVSKFIDAVHMRVEAMGNRLSNFVTRQTASPGEIMFFERLAGSEMTQRVGRHGPTPVSSNEWDRRACIPTDWEDGKLVDTVDEARLLINPKGPLSEKLAYSMGRVIDTTIINAALGVSLSGKGGTVPVTLPAGQILRGNATDVTDGNNNSGTNLTMPKLRRARLKFLEIDAVEDTEEIHLAVTASQLMHLLRSTKATSSDFSPVLALYQGKIDSYAGFRFHRTQLLPVIPATSTRTCFAWVQRGLVMCDLMAPNIRVSERNDLRHSWQIYGTLSLGAVRLEEELVVQIDCDETDATAPE